LYERAVGLDRLQALQFFYLTTTTDNFGSSTVETVYATVYSTRQPYTIINSSTFWIAFEVTKITANSYSTPTLPLTTIFTPPASCLSNIVVDNGNTLVAPPEQKQCYPSGWETTLFYSPGICPSGYHVAVSNASVYGSTSDTIETIVTCCPTYEFPHSYDQHNSVVC